MQNTAELKFLIDNQKQELQELESIYAEQLKNIMTTLQTYQAGSEQESKELTQLLFKQESQFKSEIQDLERKKEISEQILTSTNKDLAGNIEKLTDKLFSLESNSKADIVQKWDDITVKITCSFESGKKSSGSGLYFGPSFSVNFGAGNEHVILTNSHVLEEDDDIPILCTILWDSSAELEVLFTDVELESSVSRVSYIEGFDAAFITITTEEVAQANIDTSVIYDICSVAPESGEEVLILGYPKIGSKDSITSTEGIISGYDRDFFITSAKISKGNSGGAAIAVKDDCYFGIPTLVKADEVESLGRILDITNIFE